MSCVLWSIYKMKRIRVKLKLNMKFSKVNSPEQYYARNTPSRSRQASGDESRLRGWLASATSGSTVALTHQTHIQHPMAKCFSIPAGGRSWTANQSNQMAQLTDQLRLMKKANDSVEHTVKTSQRLTVGLLCSRVLMSSSTQNLSKTHFVISQTWGTSKNMGWNCK